jgi:hypothetical protein
MNVIARKVHWNLLVESDRIKARTRMSYFALPIARYHLLIAQSEDLFAKLIVVQLLKKFPATNPYHELSESSLDTSALYFKIHFNNNLPSTLYFSKWFLPFGFFYQNFILSSLLSHACYEYTSRPPEPVLFDLPTSICGRTVYGMNCLLSLEHWDRGFEYHSRHGCLCMFLLCLCCSVCR